MKKWYRRNIIAMLRKITDERYLRLIYQFVSQFLD